MKFAILADVHANLEALQAVLEDSEQQGCTHYGFLGDFVGYNADPKACLDIVRAMGAPCVKGNHDEYCSSSRSLADFNAVAQKAIEWTRRRLSEDDRRWLGCLPYVQTIQDFTLVHATLNGPERWEYVFDRGAASESMSYQKTQVCFFGHTHVPVVFIRDDVVRRGAYERIKMEKGKTYFVNAGAVGQPRDNNPKAAYVTYDLDEAVIELRRVAYDFEAAQRKIRKAGLDE